MSSRSQPSRTGPRIAIIGAGIIGLTAAYELAVRRNARVTLYDTGAPGRGASWAAAGMLAPAFEAAAEPGVHPHLFDLCLESAALWPAFAAEIADRAGVPSALNPAPALAIARDAGEQIQLERIAAALSARSVVYGRLTAREARGREPALTDTILGGLELPSDTTVHNRRLIDGLITLLRTMPGIAFMTGPAPLRSVQGQVRVEGHDTILVCCGWQTAVIKVDEGGKRFSLVNWDAALDQIDCYGGQMLSVAAGEGALQRVVRSGHVYLVPRDGQVVIGATVEQGRAIDTPEDAAIAALHAEAARLCPALAHAAVSERWTGIRPGTPDHAPLIGATACPGLFVAAGHFRNGILLAPVTAEMIADQILGAPPSGLAHAFHPHRQFHVSRPEAAK